MQTNEIKLTDLNIVTTMIFFSHCQLFWLYSCIAVTFHVEKKKKIHRLPLSSNVYADISSNFYFLGLFCTSYPEDVLFKKRIFANAH